MKKILLSIYFLACSLLLFGKDKPEIVKGEFYYISIHVVPMRHYPMYGHAISKDIPLNLTGNSYEDLLCSLYSQIVYNVDASTSFVEGFGWNTDTSSFDEKGGKFEDISQKLDHSSVEKDFFLKDSSHIYIRVAKFKGSLWKKEGKNFLNNSSHQVYVDEKCFGKNYHYLFKSIDSVLKISKSAKLYELVK